MYKYEIIIYWSNEDNSYIAEIPELPGCMADGKTTKEALSNIEEIAKEWIETAKELGRPIRNLKVSSLTHDTRIKIADSGYSFRES